MSECKWDTSKHDGKPCPIHNGAEDFDVVDLDEIIELETRNMLVGRNAKKFANNLTGLKNEKLAKKTFTTTFKEFKNVFDKHLKSVEVTTPRTLRLTNPILYGDIKDSTGGFCDVYTNGDLKIFYMKGGNANWFGDDNQNTIGTINHELGHAVFNTLALQHPEIREKYKKLYETKKPDIAKNLSQYGSTTYEEFIAECFAFHYANPNELADEVYKQLKEDYERYL